MGNKTELSLTPGWIIKELLIFSFQVLTQMVGLGMGNKTELSLTPGVWSCHRGLRQPHEKLTINEKYNL